MYAAISNRNDNTEYAALVRRLVVRATRQYPALAERLQRAQRLVLNGGQAVVLYTDHTATVQSESDPNVTYRVDGPRCGCMDAVQRGRMCKHSLAAGLHRRVLREVSDEANRRRSYGRSYQAPGTPLAVVACGACGVTALLDWTGRCPECAGERQHGLERAMTVEA